MCSVKEQHTSRRHRTSARGKRTLEHTIRVIATNLISGTVTVRAESNAEALAEVEQRINPKLKQEGYEFQLVEFLEPNRLMPDPKAIAFKRCNLH
jgi:hypothetical protein